MGDVLERRVGDLTIRIDRTLCVGFGDCIQESPETFLLDDEGIATFTDHPDAAARERLLKACEACPVDALSVVDPDGKPLLAR